MDMYQALFTIKFRLISLTIRKREKALQVSIAVPGELLKDKKLLQQQLGQKLQKLMNNKLKIVILFKQLRKKQC